MNTRPEPTERRVHLVVSEGHDLPDWYIPGFDLVTWLPDRRTYREEPQPKETNA